MTTQVAWRYYAVTNTGAQQIAKAMAHDLGGRCQQDKGVSASGMPRVTVYDINGVSVGEVFSTQNVSGAHLAGSWQ